MAESLLFWGFVLLPAGMAGLVVLGVSATSQVRERRSRLIGISLGLAVWMAATFGLAASGLVRFGSLPPRPLLLFALGLIGTALFARSAAGRALERGLPLWVLVGVQGFRLPLELLLHHGAGLGVVPPQMTYAGSNFDIVTGATAIVLAIALKSGVGSRRLVFAWNLLGVALLLNVLSIAILSMPTPLRLFVNQPANVWVSQAPYVWLPTLLVPCAVLGHILVFRKLRSDASELRRRDALQRSERPLA